METSLLNSSKIEKKSTNFSLSLTIYNILFSLVLFSVVGLSLAFLSDCTGSPECNTWEPFLVALSLITLFITGWLTGMFLILKNKIELGLFFGHIVPIILLFWFSIKINPTPLPLAFGSLVWLIILVHKASKEI